MSAITQGGAPGMSSDAVVASRRRAGPAPERSSDMSSDPGPGGQPVVQIVDAILAGDAATASRVMGEHCDATAELLRGLLG